MSQAKKVGTDFDFSGLFELMSSAKRQCWNYDRSQERFKRKLAKQHNSYFSKFKPSGGGSLASKKPKKKKGLDLRDQEDKDMDDALGIGEELAIADLQEVLKNPILISILEHRKKNKIQSNEMEGETPEKKRVKSAVAR